MNIIAFLREFGKELSGIRDEPREMVLRYVAERLEEVLQMVKGELGGDDSAREA